MRLQGDKKVKTNQVMVMADMDEVGPDAPIDIQIEVQPCGICGRKFAPKSLQKHEPICQKQQAKKRKPFNSLAQRVAGTDLADFHMPTYLKKSGREKGEKSVVSNKVEKPISKPSLIEDTPVKEKHNTVTPKRSTTSLRDKMIALASQGEKCPSCGRSFGEKAFERHVEWCKEKNQNRSQPSPASLQMAKERLAARQNYKAPALLAKSQRQINKEKYSQKSYSKQNSSEDENSSSVQSPSSLTRSPSIRKTSDTPTPNGLKRGNSIRRPSPQSASRKPGSPGLYEGGADSMENNKHSRQKKLSRGKSPPIHSSPDLLEGKTSPVYRKRSQDQQEPVTPVTSKPNDNETYDPILSAERQLQELLTLDPKSPPITLPTTPEINLAPLTSIRPKTAPSKYILDNHQIDKKLSKQTSDTNLTTILPNINNTTKRKVSATNKTTPSLSRKSSNNNEPPSPSPTNNEIKIPIDEIPIITKYTKSHLVPGIDDELITPKHFPLTPISNREKIKNDKNIKNRASVIEPPNGFQDLQNCKSIENFEIIENIINQNMNENSTKNSINLNKILFTDSVISEDTFDINPDLINSIDNLSIPDELKTNDDHFSTEYDKQMSTLETSVLPDVNKNEEDDTLFDFDSFIASFNDDNDDEILPSLKIYLRQNTVPTSSSSNFISSSTSLKSPTTSYLKRSVSVVDPVAKPKHMKNKSDVEKYLNGKGDKKKAQPPEDGDFTAEELFDVDDELYAEYKQYEEMYLKEKQRKSSGREPLSGGMGPYGEKNGREKSQSPDNKCDIKPSGDSAYSSLNRSSNTKDYHTKRGTGDSDHIRKKASTVNEEEQRCLSSSGSDVSIPVVSRKKKSTAIHKSLLNSVSNPQFDSNEFNTQINDHNMDPIVNYTSGRRKNSDIPADDNSENSAHYRNSPDNKKQESRGNSLHGSSDNLRKSSRNPSIDNLNEATNDEPPYRKISSDGQQRLPKFCHECGSKYPVSVAKFCVECGAKRLIL
ncbi:uncharacterized protein LOC123301827 isoform X2 [Chrysoperla carnea]|uniref:uncharacterized protein LOC123301827 isoform X2 n=1 Tax=Chrysoperla carnea TaxID=189513 RepID=UPI001D05DF06|nr:uncharacterized protein LOC123301827 isoform X2 [Chrysoperla carnea]